MDCPCGKFDDCSFSRFGFIVRTDRETARIAHNNNSPITIAP